MYLAVCCRTILTLAEIHLDRMLENPPSSIFIPILERLDRASAGDSLVDEICRV
jgi:hypothetical protein